MNIRKPVTLSETICGIRQLELIASLEKLPELSAEETAHVLRCTVTELRLAVEDGLIHPINHQKEHKQCPKWYLGTEVLKRKNDPAWISRFRMLRIQHNREKNHPGTKHPGWDDSDQEPSYSTTPSSHSIKCKLGKKGKVKA